jgi:Ser-tRNA(Ala) deacylase AlaX
MMDAFVVLAATLFHPQGGGQMSDTGRIDTAIMLQAVQEEGVIHFTEKAVEPGPVSIQIDGKRRSSIRVITRQDILSRIG